MVRVSTIPAGVPFLDALAKGLLAEAGDDALALADMLVLLPNRRACRSLRDAFWRGSDGQALALPTIQPIGDLDPDERLLDAASELELPPAISGLRRRLLLTRMLAPLGWTADQAGRLAEDLASLLDELQTERVAFDALNDLVPDHLAAHWQQSLRLLQVLGQHWPAVLADEEALDPAERRHRVLGAIAERWVADPPLKRIVAAGSTGSIPATRDLLAAIASLPNGEVVLPGLEVALDDETWRALDPQHPQYGLSQLLNAFNIHRNQVSDWPKVNDVDVRHDARQGVRHDAGPRRELLCEVMRPSAAIKAFSDLVPLDPAALDGLSLVEHADPAEEAIAIALRLRAALLDPTRTAALITSDRPLARRVAIELGRFGIRIDDSAGQPLDQTAPGSFLLLATKLLAEKVRPVALLSLLKHPLAQMNLDGDMLRRRARMLERICLRGPAIIGGFRHLLDELNGLRQKATMFERQENLAELRDWLESLERLARPFALLMEQSEVPLRDLIEAHLRFAEGLANVDGNPEQLWAKEAGEAASTLFRDLLAAADPADMITPLAYPALIAQLMTAKPVRPKRPGHPRLFLWGQLEARLQHADLTILAGLNEGVWPRAEEPGPWLNPSMRESLGLPPLERRIGQAAHDFVQAAAGGEVVLSRAEKDLDGNPTVPSRWLVRLKTLLASSGDEGQGLAADPCWQGWALSLDLPSNVIRPEQQPQPKPPLAARPRELSVSDVGLWMKNPYGLYAKKILKLKPLDPLEADPGAMDRGNIIHKVLEDFVRRYPVDLPEDALSRLRDLGVQAFSSLKHRPQVQAIWWPRFLEAAAWAVNRETEARADLIDILPEIEGLLQIETPGGPFRIKARADRLERLRDGRVNVVDYKTGSLPGPKDLLSGLSPQLPLEGVMVERGAFAELGKQELAELHFWRLVGDEQGGAFKGYASDLIAGTLEGLTRLIDHFDQPETGYPAGYQPPTLKRRDYDHLARLGEWPS